MTQQITVERRKQLAEKHNCNEQYLYQCLTGRREMGPIEARRLEAESDGELTRQMLCQKTYLSIWPELVEATAGKAVTKDSSVTTTLNRRDPDQPRERRNPDVPDRRVSARSMAERQALADAGKAA